MLKLLRSYEHFSLVLELLVPSEQLLFMALPGLYASVPLPLESDSFLGAATVDWIDLDFW